MYDTAVSVERVPRFSPDPRCGDCGNSLSSAVPPRMPLAVCNPPASTKRMWRSNSYQSPDFQGLAVLPQDMDKLKISGLGTRVGSDAVISGVPAKNISSSPRVQSRACRLAPGEEDYEEPIVATIRKLEGSPRPRPFYHRPSSIERVVANPWLVQFDNWVQNIPNGWEVLHDMFTKEAGHLTRGTKGLTKKRWTSMLMQRGFPHEVVLHDVFDEIATENLHEDHDVTRYPCDEITISQLKRFENRIMAVNSSLDTSSSQSPTNRFVQFLVKKCGSSLLAWKTVLDTRGTGKVAYGAFMESCRKFGYSTQAKSIWQATKKDSTKPLEFCELDPKEANNAQFFADALWRHLGFDLQQIWLTLDPARQNYVTLEQFKEGCAVLGFSGNVRLLYKGLDSSGVGRLNFQDIEYLLKIVRVPRGLASRGEAGKGCFDNLVIWAQREFGGVDELISRITCGQHQEAFFVGDLAARLTALGFEGDSLQLASRLARFDGGTSVKFETLCVNLRNQRREAGRLNSPPPSSRLSFSPRRSPITSPRLPWRSGVDNISRDNERRCKHVKEYFSQTVANISPLSRTESRTEFRSTVMSRNLSSPTVTSRNLSSPVMSRNLSSPVSLGSPRCASPSNSCLSLTERPEWNGSIDRRHERNIKMPSTVRTYFSDAQDKPIRDERRELVRSRLEGLALRAF